MIHHIHLCIYNFIDKSVLVMATFKENTDTLCFFYRPPAGPSCAARCHRWGTPAGRNRPF